MLRVCPNPMQVLKLNNLLYYFTKQRFAPQQPYHDLEKSTNVEPCNLKDRNVICVRNLSSDDLKSLLWTAIDLKSGKSNNTKLLQYNRITILLEERNIKHQFSADYGCNQLGGQSSVVYDENLIGDFNRENQLVDLGKLLSSNCDLIVASVSNHSTLEEMSKGSRVPIINMSSCFQTPLEALSILMTTVENFNKLNKLRACIIGSPCPLMNSILCSFPRLGIATHISCFTKQNLMMSPRFLNVAETYAKEFESHLVECNSQCEAMANADIVVALCDHDNNLKLEINDFSVASTNWKLFNSIPRSKFICDGLRDHQNNLTFDGVTNLRYIYSAVYIRMLGIAYQHLIEKPQF